MNVATPVFIDSIGQDEDKNIKDLEKLSKQYPNATFLLMMWEDLKSRKKY
ncbi:hypothetical protein [Staphylococcus haemolyticus]|nr:hypothetical protein [Staphylococcus haemolyticus]MCH4444473.1 hypothetical protein [Staphylococcus haemolyticus]